VVRAILSFSLACILLSACSTNDDKPKPRGYFRIDFPEKKYLTYNDSCPFSFSYPQYALVRPDRDVNAEPCWLNIDYPKFGGRLHLSYKVIPKEGVRQFLEDSRMFAYKHTVKAEAIDEELIFDKESKVYGVIYDIKGNTASSYQFFVTDSTTHFLRGALYFNTSPNSDSIAPVLDFIKQDVLKMIETFEWK
jgi:gliding motility-associated lipoprotein GldD